MDNSATSRPCPAACASVREMLEESWHNPSASYAEAVRAEKRVAKARETLAGAMGMPTSGIVFTGSGTEADSLAILGTAARFRGPRRVLLFAGEHPAALQTAGQLQKMGHYTDFVPATDQGLLDLAALEDMLQGETGLVSCMQVNNETGAVQPIGAIGTLMRQKCPEALFHVDGVQGFLRVPLDLAASGVDVYAVSGHKVHGVKGVGALAVKKGVRLEARVAGGGQEGGLRSGTENTAGICAFAAAVSWVRSHEGAAERLRAMKLALYRSLAERVEGLRVNGPEPDGPDAAPHILNVSFPGVGGEVMLHALEAEGVLVGTGAACSSKKREMSAAFRAMRAPDWAAKSAVRFSFGLMNTIEEAGMAAEAAIRCYQRYRNYQRR